MPTAVDRSPAMQLGLPPRNSSLVGPMSPVSEIDLEDSLSSKPIPSNLMAKDGARRPSPATEPGAILPESINGVYSKDVWDSQSEVFSDTPDLDSLSTPSPAGSVGTRDSGGDENAEPVVLEMALSKRLSRKSKKGDKADGESSPQTIRLDTSGRDPSPPWPSTASPDDQGSKSRPGSLQRRLSSTLRRRSWMPGSRSPSPKKNEDSPNGGSTVSPGSGLDAGRQGQNDSVIQASPRFHQRRASFSKHFTPRLPRRPSSILIKETAAENKSQKWAGGLKANHLPKSFSADKLTFPSPIPPSRSSDRLSTFLPSSRSGDRLSTFLPSSRSGETLSGLVEPEMLAIFSSSKTRAARRRDPLWQAYRDLESACTKFQRQKDNKVDVVQAVLLPFLQEYKSHPSSFNLHPEDIERRVGILSKWWTALTEFHNGRMFPHVTSQARSATFDAVIGIIERLEWKHAFSPSTSGPDKRYSDASSASNSGGSTFDHDVLVAVKHNIRNQFTSGLLAQMEFVVEKMTFRTVPALVAFCGKICAYAWFYCPEFARTLIRLWRQEVMILERVLEENGVTLSTEPIKTSAKVRPAAPTSLQDERVVLTARERSAKLPPISLKDTNIAKTVNERPNKPPLFTLKDVNLTETAKKVASMLPRTVRELQLTTLSETYEKLSKLHKLPLGTEHWRWTGPWADRWRGHDSDLFYAFVKNWQLIYFDLVPDATKTQRIATAGGIFVQAQILIHMDATIHHHVPPEPQRPAYLSPSASDLRSPFVDETTKEQGQTATNITFDDMFADPDSAVPPILLGANGSPAGAAPSTNGERNLATNRLIMLLGDILSTSRSNTTPIPVRNAFAQSFADLLRGAAKATQQFCRTATEPLCDFLEETIVVLVRYEQSTDIREAFLDWSFWFKVWIMMAETHSYFLQVRLLSLIYLVWPAIAIDSARKTELCTTFLLDKTMFHLLFENFSPVVRAFFMRLLCWRVSSCNGVSTAEDVHILELVLTRLKETYGSYLSARQLAQRNGRAPPRTEPSTGGHNKRFMIVKMAFDATETRHIRHFKSSVLPENPPYKRLILLERLFSLNIPEGERPSTAQSFASSNHSDSDGDQDDGPKRRLGGGLLRAIISNSKQKRTKSQSPSRNGNAVLRPPTSTPAEKSSDPRAAGNTTSPEGNVTKPSAVPLFDTYCFRFGLESFDPLVVGGPPTLHLQTPRLPHLANVILTHYLSDGIILNPVPEASQSASGLNPPGRPNGVATQSGPNSSGRPNGVVTTTNTHSGPVYGRPNGVATASAHSGLTSSGRPIIVTTTNAQSRPNGPSVAAGGFIAGPRPVPTTPSRSPMDRTASAPMGRVLIPTGRAVINSPYVGRALAEWYFTVSEYHGFSERRRAEGVPGVRWVETPLLGAETLKNSR